MEMRSFATHALSLIGACIALSACDSSQGSLQGSRSEIQPSAAKRDSRYAGSTPIAYAADIKSGQVFIFSQAGKGQKPVSSISGFAYPQELAVGQDSGDLFVADLGPGKVFAYHQGQTSPYRTISVPSSSISEVALDNSEDVYVSNPGSPIYIFPSGSGSYKELGGSNTLVCDDAYGPDGIAVDANSDILAYVNGEFGAWCLFEYPNGSETPVSVNTGNSIVIRNISFDSQQNLLLATSEGIEVLAPPYSGKVSKLVKEKDTITDIVANSSNSAAWASDQTKHVLIQLSYPGLKKVSTTKPLKNSVFNAVATFPASSV